MFNLTRLALKLVAKKYSWEFGPHSPTHLISCFQDNWNFTYAISVFTRWHFFGGARSYCAWAALHRDATEPYSLATSSISSENSDAFNSFLLLAWTGKWVARFTRPRWHFGNPYCWALFGCCYLTVIAYFSQFPKIKKQGRCPGNLSVLHLSQPLS